MAVCVALAWPLAGHAQLHLEAESVVAPGVSMDGVQVTLTEGGDGDTAMHAEIASLDVAALGWRRVAARFEGRVLRAAPRYWRIQGDLALTGAAGRALRKATLALDLDAEGNTLQVRVAGSGATRVDLSAPLDDPAHLQINLARVPVAWMQGVLAQAWSDGQLGAGSVDADVALDVLDDGLRGNGSFRLAGAAFDSRQGTLAGQALSGSGTWSLRTDADASRLDLDSRWTGGEILLGPLYASLPDGSSRLQLRADFSAAGTRLSRVQFDDGGTLRFDGGMRLGADGAVSSVQLDGLRAQLPAAYQRYGKAWLATLGYDDLDTEGMFTGSLVVQDGALDAFSLDATAVGIRDPQQRIGLENLRGRLDWSREGTRAPGELAWDALTLVHLPFGAASTAWRSTDGMLMLQQPTTLPLFGGRLIMQSFAWSPATAAGQTHVALALAAADVPLEPLCERFGWPRFQGRLGGAVPGLSLDEGRLVFDGGLSMHVFDGFVDVTNLSLAHPFGATPELRADVSLRHLDLDALTGVFDFGNITGRLDGEVAGLRMLAWKPVAFDASLRADEGGRISQHAIDSLGRLGGGIGGGLQSTVLKVFKSFAYSRIALGCRLSEDTCHMRGAGEADDGGYVIVAGHGLPHIEVVGHEREVDWPTLVARLVAATAGGSVRVE